MYGGTQVFSSSSRGGSNDPRFQPSLEQRGLAARGSDTFRSDWRRPSPGGIASVAFTAGGDRLGQGGGWYDRFLPHVRSNCTTIGVCFEPQLVDMLPLEPHDVRLDHVVSDRRPDVDR